MSPAEIGMLAAPPSLLADQRRPSRPMMALAVVAVVLVGVVGFHLTTAQPANAASLQEETGSTICGNLPVISASCNELLDATAWAIGATTETIGESVVAGAFDYFARWVAIGAIGAIDLVWVGIDQTTTPSVDTSTSVFNTSLAAARTLAIPLLVLAALYSMLKRDAEIAVKSALLYLPGSVLGMVVAGYVITLLLAATDQLSDAYIDTGETGVAVWLDNLGGSIASGVGITAPILLVIFSFLLIVGSVLVWLVMIVRTTAILVTYAFMPLAFAAVIFPATRSWIKRLIEIQLSFILAKPVIVAVLALGAQTLNEADHALVAMVQASSLFYLAAFSPFALMKLLPFVGDQAVAAMEQPSGAPSRAVATAAGVIGGQRLAGFLAGSQQAGPATVVSASPGPGGGGAGGNGGPMVSASMGRAGGASEDPSRSGGPGAEGSLGGSAEPGPGRGGGGEVSGGEVSGGELPGGSAGPPLSGNEHS